jgi:hypothetical protein
VITRTLPASTWDIIRATLSMARVTLANDSSRREFADYCAALSDELAKPQGKDVCPACGQPELGFENMDDVHGECVSSRDCYNCGSTIRIYRPEYVSPNHAPGDENLPGPKLETASDVCPVCGGTNVTQAGGRIQGRSLLWSLCLDCGRARAITHKEAANE